jgi:hypothetical protein
LRGQADTAWRAFLDGLDRLAGYLMEHHPAEYDAILREHNRRDAEARAAGGRPVLTAADATWDRKQVNAAIKRHQEKVKRGESTAVIPDWPSDLIAAYRTNFDPAAVEAELKELEAEHTAMYRRYADLPTPRAKEKAKAELSELEAKITELERQKEDMAGSVAALYRQVHDLQMAIADARLAMKNQAGEQALRRLAETLRGVIHRIECRFEATGRTGCGRGNSNSRLASVTIYPVAGDPAEYPAGENVLQPSGGAPPAYQLSAFWECSRA